MNQEVESISCSRGYRTLFMPNTSVLGMACLVSDSGYGSREHRDIRTSTSHAEHGADRLSTQHLTRGPKRHELPRVHNAMRSQNMAAWLRSCSRHHHRQPLTADEIESPIWWPISRWLVGSSRSRICGSCAECAGDMEPLALAASKAYASGARPDAPYRRSQAPSQQSHRQPPTRAKAPPDRSAAQFQAWRAVMRSVVSACCSTSARRRAISRRLNF